MKKSTLRLTSMSFALALAFSGSILACTDDGGDEVGMETSGDGDGDGDATGDGDGDPATGDGDGDATGDGDGDATGDGDGDPTGDGDGDPTGDGDGDATGDGDGDPTGDGDGDPPMGLSFAGDVYPIIMANCSCHVGGAPAGLAMPDAGTAYDNLVSVGASQNGNLNRVEPGDPASSYMFQKVNGDAPGTQMPLNGQPLSPEQLMLISDWITQGAMP